MASLPRFRSLRWQLPLSYGAIALLAVLVLGITLLGSLRSFYREQELAYLRNNAIAIANEIAPLLTADERPFLQSQIAGFAFLTQARAAYAAATIAVNAPATVSRIKPIGLPCRDDKAVQDGAVCDGSCRFSSRLAGRCRWRPKFRHQY